MAMFPSNDDCKRYLQERRWPKGVKCPRCGNEKVYGSKSRPFTWQCKECGKNTRAPYRFSVIAGTIFENTNYPLKTWFEVLWSMLNAKKGISAMQIQRQIGCGSYQTAWYMCHRLRAGMQDDDFRQLMGIVEVDETYVGGKNKNRHKDKRTPGRGTSGKTPVIGAISRKGSVVAQMVEFTDTPTLEGFVRKAVSENVELVATDDHSGYDHLSEHGFNHEAVNHSQGEYVRGLVHTGTIDGFWSLLKRGIMGSYHHVSKKYLPLYINEFSYRYNNRNNPDMFGEAVAGC
jgi:transposase-like protein